MQTPQAPPPPNSTTVDVSVNTNCRSGPGVGYQGLDIVYSGQRVEVLGVDESHSYYIVRSPNGSVCWLWSHYATLDGKINSLPVMTPPAPSQNVNSPKSYTDVGILVSKDFSWSGRWIVGYPAGQSYIDWLNEQSPQCSDCGKYEGGTLDITQNGNLLDIEFTESIIWPNRYSDIFYIYGLAQTSQDNSIAVGTFYLQETTPRGDPLVLNFPIFWYQNGSPNQFIGAYDQLVQCAAREGAPFPLPCVWP